MPDESSPRVAPPGHSRASHRAHGWCSRCPGREVWEELHAWRIRENALEGEPGVPDKAVGPSPEVQRRG
ncbi:MULTISPECIES: hypothetical protein [unclassified Streptomyces]|uniref:hypothetical protein n=1 Tax=unclassified Streptomyces TaxID=2593676 RepID=UPI0003710E96|nr:MULTISPECIES: hypothetical protein [unclassified Streptomyces]MYX39023.1 hypothetical protein [Streptomyces sp. SID8377]